MTVFKKIILFGLLALICQTGVAGAANLPSPVDKKMAVTFDKDDLADFGALLKFLKSTDSGDYAYLIKHIRFYDDNCRRGETLARRAPQKTSGGTIVLVAYHHGDEARVYSVLLSDFHDFYKNVNPWIPTLANIQKTDIRVAGRDFHVTGPITLRHPERLAPNAQAYMNGLLTAITRADYRQCAALAGLLHSTGAI